MRVGIREMRDRRRSPGDLRGEIPKKTGNWVRTGRFFGGVLVEVSRDLEKPPAQNATKAPEGRLIIKVHAVDKHSMASVWVDWKRGRPRPRAKNLAAGAILRQASTCWFCVGWIIHAGSLGKK